MDSTDIFDHLSSKIGQLFYGKTLGDRNSISKILDELNSLNYRFLVVKNPTKAVLLINQCCSSIDPDDEDLVPKCAKLITNLVNLQKVSIEGTTLAVSVQWCLPAVKSSHKNIVVLRALETLIRGNIQNVSTLLDLIFADIKRQIDLATAQGQEQVLLASVLCLEASTVLASDEKGLDLFKTHLERCAEVFLAILQSTKSSEGCVSRVRVLETCIYGLRNVITLHPAYLESELALILGIVKTYMLYGVQDVEFLAPERLLPSTLSIPEASNGKSGGKVIKQRKNKRTLNDNKKRDKKEGEGAPLENKSGAYAPATANWDYSSDSGLGRSNLMTSDSDFSDNKVERLAKLPHFCNRLRQAALNLFADVIKNSERAVMFTYWSNFVSESPSFRTHNMLTCILKDPSTRGKLYALNALLLLLNSGKTYLLQAESSNKASSFTPFSVSLGLTLTVLHKGLCLALNHSEALVLAQVLKCLAALVQATPYHRMGRGFISKVIRNVKGLISHWDATVQVTALIVVGCIVAFEPPHPETMRTMTKLQKQPSKAPAVCSTQDFDFAQFSSEEDEEEEELPEMEANSMPWLVQVCLRNLGAPGENGNSEKTVPAPVKLESLQVLSTLSRNYFEPLMLPHLVHITRALETSLADRYVDLRLHAGRAVEILGKTIGVSENLGPATYSNFWQVLLGGPLISLIQNEDQAILRATGCDCLGSIGPQIFQQLPRDKQILCVTLLFGCTKDEDYSVRGAALRALGLCVLYPSLREDSGFVMDTSEAILQALTDENNNVRAKASWAFGTLSSALVLNKAKSSDCPEDAFPQRMLLQLLETGVQSAKDNDRVKMNVVRAIGNLLQLVSADLLKDHRFQSASEQALDALVSASTMGSNVKARWNACYALGHALKNSDLYSSWEGDPWQASAFTKLAELVVGFKNFKVRTNAALALSCPPERRHYGPFFLQVWTAALRALENSQNVEDFTEYNHRDHLVDQICLCLGHLTALLTLEDLPHLESSLNLYSDTFKVHMRKVAERVLPEKATELFSAQASLKSLGSKSDLGATERRVIGALTAIFALK